MTGFLGQAKDSTGPGLDQTHVYVRAFEKECCSKDVLTLPLCSIGPPEHVPTLAIPETGQGKHSPLSLPYNLPDRPGPLIAKLACRQIEAALVSARHDLVRSRDLHRTTASSLWGKSVVSILRTLVRWGISFVLRPKMEVNREILCSPMSVCLLQMDRTEKATCAFSITPGCSLATRR